MIAEPEGLELALVPISEATDLPALAAAINEEHRLVEVAATQAVVHAIRAGETLADAKTQVPWGRWRDWLEANFDGTYWMATTYMRLAHHKSLLPDGVSIKDALAAIRGQRELPKVAPGLENVALQLRAEGVPVREIARRLDVGRETVTRWVRPRTKAEKRKRALEERRRRDRGRKARQALRAAEQARAMAKVGGSIAECYSLVRRATQAVDRERESADGRARIALAAAVDDLYRAEDAIARALKMRAEA